MDGATPSVGEIGELVNASLGIGVQALRERIP